MSKKYKKLDLDAEEKEIEDNIESLEPITGHARSRIVKMHKESAKKYLKKNKRITIRVYEGDLAEIKRMAEEEGLNYQTYITSILHKICTGRLRNTSV